MSELHRAEFKALVARRTGVSIQARRMRCNKPNCARCPHATYYFAKWRDGTKVRSLYLGTTLPVAAQKLLRKK